MRRSVLTTLALCATLAVSACGADEPDGTADTPEAPATPDIQETAVGGNVAPDDGTTLATAQLEAADGQPRGTVEFRDVDAGLQVRVSAEGLEPGFHGLHLHEVGACAPDSQNPNDPGDVGDFLSSGGHLGEGDHPEHAGDLPSLLVMEDGTAELHFVTDRVDAATLLDDDGTAVIVHGGTDNFANIPDRYADGGPDQDTLGTGDAGERVACGVVTGQ
ncbi:MAG: superoxide dismutase family protein [Mobilicoccus sp.]|nr:superoxide dismutase family protein [Mobilicoccus sp.]